MGACQRAPAPAANAAAAAAADAKPGYLRPPELDAVTTNAGGLELVGSAQPGANVRIATPAGPPAFAAADARGVWRVAAPRSATPQFYSLSTSDSGRLVQAKGYLFVAPDGMAARLRAGGGSEALGEPALVLAVLAIDYDNQRAATVSGRAPVGDSLKLRVDGVERGQASADPGGRFVIPLTQPLAAGDHDFDVEGHSGEIRFSAPIDAPAPLAGAPLKAARSAGGWRVDWLTPGGGEQTTLIFAHPETPA